MRKHWCYSKCVRDFQIDKDTKSQGWLYGKKLIQGLKNFTPKRLNKKQKFEKFIIGFKNGKEISFTCNEDKLSDFFGKNKGKPNYLTPVFFRKDVLTKYYSQPAKYSVGDGYVRCGDLWHLEIDNNHPDHVMVFLGDLGHLAYNEQLYWKHYNFAGKGKISYTCWTRSFQGEFSDPEKSDLFLKLRYRQFQKKWKEKFGWYLFLPLSQEDKYHFKTLRIPLTNEQNEFDDQVLSLTKLIIDSLNEKELARGIIPTKENWKGIDKLEAFLESKKIKIPQMIKFLRDLQDLRSTGVAHLKGKKYARIKKTFGIEVKELSKVFEDIIVSSIKTLNSLENIFLKD